jgi:hypothetical protein
MEELSKLPFVYQAVGAAGIFFGTFMIAIVGWIWKGVKGKLPEALGGPASHEIAIPFTQIVDSGVYAKLGVSIEGLIDFLKIKDDGEERELQQGFNSLSRCMTDILKEQERTTKAVERLERALEHRTVI